MLSSVTLILLCALSFPPSVSSRTCDNNQYLWPQLSPRLCCDKCAPGEHMLRRSQTTCNITCRPCTDGRYTNKHNTELSCSVCRTCERPNMEYESICAATHNAVCRCKHGHRCKDVSCSQCTPDVGSKLRSFTTAAKPGYIMTTVKAVTPTSVRAAKSSTLMVPLTPTKETWWWLVIIIVFCLGISLFIAINIQPFVLWLKSRCGSFTPPKPARLCPVEDEDVSMPIQEIGGKDEESKEVVVEISTQKLDDRKSL